MARRIEGGLIPADELTRLTTLQAPDKTEQMRPAYVEVDLEALFSEELYADFTAFWLLAHASRFGKVDAEPSDCPWEPCNAADIRPIRVAQ